MNNIFPRSIKIAILFAALLISTFSLFAEEKLDPARIHEIASWLPEQPAGFAWPITNRAAWKKLAADPAFKKTLRYANKLLAKPLTNVPDSLYLEYSTNGNRTHWQNAEFERRTRIARFTWAEALENKGRFLPAIEKTIAVLCAEKTWVYPAHDGSLANFKGQIMNPELGATGLAAELAEADYILGDKLTPATRQLLRDNVRRRVLDPFRDSVEGRRKPLHWLFLKMNWNSVCVGNTVFAAMALEPSRDDRAVFAAAGEHYIQYFLDGFTPDGYCAEGVGYWNYGYSHFILIAETLRQATGNKIDLFNNDRAIAGGLFCRRSEIVPGVFLTIADCTPGNKPAPELAGYVARRLGLPVKDSELIGESSGLALGSLLSSLPKDLPVIQMPEGDISSPLRTFFPDNGVLLMRNTPGASPIFGVAIKGGRNDGPHNHDDSGSFSLVLGQHMMICDPGGEVYTARTFGPHRYDSKLLNSYGHAIPVVAGSFQKNGPDARADMLETNFTAASDVFKLDLRSAYPVPTLESLERTFTFNRGTKWSFFHRGKKPSLLVSDAVKFSTPEQFETALVTWGKVKEVKQNVLEINDQGSRVRVTIDTQGRPFKWNQELITEDPEGKRKPSHLGIVLTDKISDAIVTLKIEPVK